MRRWLPAPSTRSSLRPLTLATTAGSVWPPSTRCRRCRQTCGRASPRRCRPTRRWRSAQAMTSSRAPTEKRRGSEAVWNDALDGRLPDTPDRLAPGAGHEGRCGAAQRASSARRRRSRSRTREARNKARRRFGNGSRCGVPCTRHSHFAAAASRSTTCANRFRKRRPPLPTSFLTALHVLGDASCLEPIAAAWAAADGDRTPERLRWRHQLASALRAIAQREKITRRHASMKRIAARWPGLCGLGAQGSGLRAQAKPFGPPTRRSCLSLSPQASEP